MQQQTAIAQRVFGVFFNLIGYGIGRSAAHSNSRAHGSALSTVSDFTTNTLTRQTVFDTGAAAWRGGADTHTSNMNTV